MSIRDENLSALFGDKCGVTVHVFAICIFTAFNGKCVRAYEFSLMRKSHFIYREMCKSSFVCKVRLI